MKVAIGHKLKNGPWGGGNSFVKNLSKAMINEGFSVFYDLNEPDLDFIVLTDPRSSSENVSFSANSILSYISKNPKTLVIHRINECDERKNTYFMNLRLRIANYCADHTVFVGSWLQDLNLMYKHKNVSKSVILNGADDTLFNQNNHCVWDGLSPIKLVTHHWGGNWLKGFDTYKKLDDLLIRPEWSKKIEFTYIGNLPKNFKFKNAKYIKPLSGKALAGELKKHHIYVTGSVNEPGGNHQIEGGSCGLPLLFLNSGCMPEYCNGYGVCFDSFNFEYCLKKIIKNYFFYQKKMKDFPHKSNNTSLNWIKLFYSLYSKKDYYINARKEKRSMTYYFLNQLIY